MNRLLLSSFVALATATFTTAAWANPNDKNPAAALAVFGGEISEKLRTQAEPLYMAADKDISGFVEAAAQNKLANVKALAIGQAHVKLTQLERLVSQLRILGEPAGFELDLRIARLREQFTQILRDYKNLPQNNRLVAAAEAALQQQEPLRMRELKQIELLAGQKKWAAAEVALNAMFDENQAMSVFLDMPTIYSPFTSVNYATDAVMRPLRENNAQAALISARDQQRPKYNELVRDIAAAAKAIGSSGQADVAGQTMAGPAALRELGERWRKLHVAAQRGRAIEWARIAALNAPSSPREPSIVTDLEAEYARFTPEIVRGLVALIEADTARATQAEVAVLYADYLRELAPLVARSQGSGLANAAEAALQKLKAKSPDFAANVDAYRASTDELLRWRRRTAETFASSQMAAYQPVDKQLVAATRSDENFRGLFPADLTTPAPALIGSAPEIMPRASARLMGKKAAVLDLAGLPGNKFAIGSYRSHTYASIAMAGPLTAHVAALKSDLMVTDQSPALSLAAAQAIDSAERGDLAAVGGTIFGIHLESVVTRFASLPESASSLVPLGTMPHEPDEQEKMSLVVMRFELQPLWAQHSYFFVKFPEPAAASAE